MARIDFPDWQLIPQPNNHVRYFANKDSRSVLAITYNYTSEHPGWCINHYTVGSRPSRPAVWVDGIPTEEEAVAKAQIILIAMRLAWPG